MYIDSTDDDDNCLLSILKYSHFYRSDTFLKKKKKKQKLTFHNIFYKYSDHT